MVRRFCRAQKPYWNRKAGTPGTAVGLQNWVNWSVSSPFLSLPEGIWCSSMDTWLSCAEIPTALKSQSTLHVHALVIHILNCHFSFQNTVHTLSIILYYTLFHLQARSFNHAAFDIAEGSGSNSQSAELSKPKLFLFLMAPPKKYFFFS